MKRVLDDPVLAQLDFLINGPPKAARVEEAVEATPPPPPLAPNPVLAQLDALINGAPPAAASAASPVAPPPLLVPLLAPVVDDVDDVRRGPPGILREYGGVRGWMARHAASPARTTPSSPGTHTNSPSDQTS